MNLQTGKVAVEFFKKCSCGHKKFKKVYRLNWVAGNWWLVIVIMSVDTARFLSTPDAAVSESKCVELEYENLSVVRVRRSLLSSQRGSTSNPSLIGK